MAAVTEDMDPRQEERHRFVLNRHRREVLEHMEERLQYVLNCLQLMVEVMLEILVPRPLAMAAAQVIFPRKSNVEHMRCHRFRQCPKRPISSKLELGTFMRFLVMKHLVLECRIPIALLISQP